MDAIPISLALTAGALAVVNPCGFALLPAYISMLVLDDTSDKTAAARRGSIKRALGFAAAMTLGFGAVFGVFGLVLSSLAGPILTRLPWFTVVLGVAVALGGLGLLLGKTIPGPSVPTGGAGLSRSFGSIVLFGGSYALASLGCTIGPFLVTVVATFRTGSIGGGVAVFIAYALGMGLVVAAVSLAVALAKSSMVSTLRRSGGLISRLGGALLLISGLYVAYYGWFEIRVFRGTATSDPIISAGAAVQRFLAAGLDRIGVLGAVVAVVVLIVAVVAVRRGRRTRASA